MLNASYEGVQAADLILWDYTDDNNTNVPDASSFPAKTGTGSLTEVQALSIAADFTGTTVSDGSKSEAPSSSEWAAEVKQVYEESAEDQGETAADGDAEYASDSVTVIKAAEPWNQLSSLIGQLYPFGGSLYSLDNDVTISSAATVTAVNKPTVYSITGTTSGVAAGGYVLPAGFTMTFPSDFSVNTALAGAELPVADEASPPPASAIGTVTVKTPVASEFGGSNGTITGSVFVINANSSITQPDLELSFGSGIYLLGTFPTTLTFPLTLTFGEASVGGAPDPIPFSSITIAFPAKTSPIKALNCSSLGQVAGGGTDEVAALAAQFGDTTDGYAASGNSPVTFGSTRTVVTDLCAPTTSGVKIAGIKKDAPTVNMTLKGNGGSQFTNAVITLPSGITAKGLKAKDLKIKGAKLKSVSGKGAKVTVTFKSKTKSATVDFVKGLVASSKLEKSVTKKKTKSLAIKFTVKYATATSTAGSVTVKKLS